MVVIASKGHLSQHVTYDSYCGGMFFVYCVAFINIKYKVFEQQIKIKPKINPWRPMLIYDKLTLVSSRKLMLTLTSFC